MTLLHYELFNTFTLLNSQSRVQFMIDNKAKHKSLTNYEAWSYQQTKSSIQEITRTMIGLVPAKGQCLIIKDVRYRSRLNSLSMVLFSYGSIILSLYESHPK